MANVEKNKNIDADKESFDADRLSALHHSKRDFDHLKNSIVWKKNASFDAKDTKENEEIALQSIEHSLWWAKEQKNTNISYSSQQDIVSEQSENPMYIPPSVQEGKRDAVASVETLVADAPKDSNRIAAGVGDLMKRIMDTETVA